MTHFLRPAGAWLLASLLVCGSLAPALAEDSEAEAKSAAEVQNSSSGSSSSSTGSGGKGNEEKPKYPPFDQVLKDAKVHEGLIKLHEKEDRVYAELTNSHFNKEYIVLISIARGIGQQPLLGGMSWGFGDDWVWQFRKVGDQIHVVRRNVRFTAKEGSPEQRAVKLAYTDSVLFSLPVTTKSPSGAYIVDLTPVFMSDLPQISMVLPGFSFSPQKSSWAQVKTFPNNIELQVSATYASNGTAEFDSVADSRGATIGVHYSISQLPSNGYQPRLADDRVGYFLTVLKNYSKHTERDRFVRYINRWDLQKADPSAKLSPPKEPIIFWLEKTIPYQYRKPIREGILEWNKAFEQAGFVNAIEVRQQPDDATWDPEDINYNTFRWITTGAGFAMGPSRVNPKTGQILDADIIFDADFLSYWKQEYETFTPEGIAALTGGPLDLESYRKQMANLPEAHRHSLHCQCNLSQGSAMQLAFGSAMLAARQQNPEDLEKLITQALKDVTMHEVGHTLGLRHNFKASRLYSLEELSDTNKTRETGLAASVMDYTPVNLVPKDQKQGDYYSTTIGPYDIWAIQYGYTPFSGGTEGERKELEKIAARSGEKELAYATDEDTRGIDPDPSSNRYDLGDDGVAYAKMQAQLVSEAWPDIIEKMTKDGDGFQQARRAFGVLLGTHGRSMHLASRYVGGLFTSRSHKGDEGAKPPFEVVAAEKQREAIKLLEEQVFSDKPFQFPPELYNHLAATNWRHWGSPTTERADFPAHRVISMWQERILTQLLSPLTLERLHDSELKVPVDQDAFTTAELIERLTKAVFSETEKIGEGEFTNRKPAISSIRRNLQRSYLKRLSELAMGKTSAPQDCQTVAYSQLVGLEGRIQNVLKSNNKLDTYTRAHLEESASRIRKVLDASLTLSTP